MDKPKEYKIMAVAFSVADRPRGISRVDCMPHFASVSLFLLYFFHF